MKVISVENISKKFVLAHDRPKSLADAARGLLRRTKCEEFWALKDVSFQLEQGEALGIIGHNGAGKSTMLKLLTRIMQPSSGRIRIRGRVSALIEVGAGFHPEMTGRENIFLNGAILGMTRREIDRKFDEIVAFAELEGFIDTPVKRYSSGMYARLGFAVIAHLEPEVLLVDEVLSVGDEAFQIRCQERMCALMKSGVTVVFVSHNFPAVVALCPQALVVSRGERVFLGDSTEAVRVVRRLASYDSTTGASGEAEVPRTPVRINRMRLLDDEGREVEEFACGSPINIELSCEADKAMPGLNFGVEIARSDGLLVYDVNSGMDGYVPAVEAGVFRLLFRVRECKLVDGVYSVSAGVMERDERVHYHLVRSGVHFVVRDTMPYRGVARFEHEWLLAAPEQTVLRTAEADQP